MKNNLIYLLIVNVFVVLLLTWIGQQRLADFKSYHIAIAHEATQSAASAITGFIREKKRQVRLFSVDNAELINQFAESPDNESIYIKLKNRISVYFPNYFAFNVVDKTGELVRDDFDGFIGEMCMLDLSKFTIQDKQFSRIHPNEEAYHFDVLAKLAGDKTQDVLLISFHADVMGAILKSAETAGHQLMLIYPDASDLIEVTADGARINWNRDDYRLTPVEKKRILFSNEVADTVWSAIDMHHPALFKNFRNTVIEQSLFILVLFVMISLVMYSLLKKEAVLRRRAEQYKDDFLSTVSHELRTPITSIKGSLGLIKNGIVGDVNAEMHQMLEIASSNCDRLSLLINDLLDIQKIEAGKMEFNVSKQDMVVLVQQSIQDLKAYADQFGVNFKLHSKVDSVCVMVDHTRISQVMANLLSNAVKYGADKDEINVLVELDERCVCVSVSDHGTGIPESFRNRVFSKFSQADGGMTRKVGGTGLGLYIVKKIIEKHNGKVGFESDAGKGTRFYIEIPVC